MNIHKIPLIMIIFILMFSNTIFALDNPPKVNAQGAVLMDFESGRILWENNACSPMPMASTTKIMTAIIALENSKLDDIVRASKKAANTPPVKMKLKEGEELRMEDLLYALMMQSSNDAAVAIAEHIGGTVDNFCNMMTEKAKLLGCKDTVFRTPNGLDSNDHHSTAEDMAIIAKYALNNKEFVRITNTKTISFKSNKSSYSIINKNRLLSEYEGATGMKTGYTGKAGHCFVGSAIQNDMQLISVVLASGWGNKGKAQKWIDTKAILNYGFKNYKYKDIIKAGNVYGKSSIIKGRESEVEIISSADYRLPLREDEIVRLEADYPLSLEAPIKKGQEVGILNIYINGEKFSQIPLVTSTSVDRHDFKTSLTKILDNWIKLVLGAI